MKISTMVLLENFPKCIVLILFFFNVDDQILEPDYCNFD
jgi:hypothetical protein